MIYAVLIGDVGRRQEVIDFLLETKHYDLVTGSVTDDESVVIGLKGKKKMDDITLLEIKETLKSDIERFKLVDSQDEKKAD